MILTISSLIKSKDLLRAWTERTIRARYQQSLLGGLWIIIQPLATVALFSIIFTYFVPVDTGNIPYPVFSYAAMIPWMFLASSLSDMTDSLVTNMDLVTKIYFPREILPLASMLARLLDFVVALSLLFILMLIFKMPIYPMGWLFLPVILVIQLALIIGVGLTLAAANVFFRDIRSLLALGIQLWFYASPIIYPVSMVPEQLRPIYNLNPMTGIIEAYRAVLIYHSLPPSSLYISAVIAFLMILIGYIYFKRAEYQFADLV